MRQKVPSINIFVYRSFAQNCKAEMSGTYGLGRMIDQQKSKQLSLIVSMNNPAEHSPGRLHKS